MSTATIFHLFTLLISTTSTISTATTTTHHHRHLLHQPFFPLTTPPPTQSPSFSPQPQPHQLPKYPFSTTPSTPQRPFFPSYHSPPPPPSPNSLATFPANISSILFPHQRPSSPSHHRRAIVIAVSTTILFATLLVSLLIFLLFKHRHPSTTTTTTIEKSSRSDSLRLFPPNTAPSDGSHHHKQPPRYTSSNTSSEFLYLGTLVNSRGGIDQENIMNSSNAGVKIGVSVATHYQKLGSPELRPLPPLPRYNVFSQNYQSGEQFNPSDEVGACGDNVDDAEDEEFFSPRGSSGRKESPNRIGSSSRGEFQGIGGDHFGSRSFNSRTASYPYSNSCSPTNSITTSASPVTNASPRSLKSKSPDSIINFPAPKQPIIRSPVSMSSSSSSSERNSGKTQNSPDRISSFPVLNKQSPEKKERISKQFVPIKLPPPPPPPPPPRFWEIPDTSRMIHEPNSGPPVLVTPSRPVVLQSLATNFAKNEELKRNEDVEKNQETPKPKLKPLHWDKVRASSDRAMVWDQIKSSSFQLNEEMIETLFMVNNSNLTPKDTGWRQVVPSMNQENRVLDPKKSQNIAILFRALNVTIDEVCEALLEGNSDTLGTELLESLLKMAPTKEEERKLKDFKDESPFKLGPAEKFLKAVIDIPFAFKRVDAMLYIVNFDSEVEYLRRSFGTLETACEELRKSRMFLKLLEAVLKTGNRMNVGTNRGDAHAFKLDTLLKLVDVKGTDGRTTLLHFVVQEIIKSEGSRLSGANQNLKGEKTEQSVFQHDVEFRKLGLQVVSSLSGELTNVKKAAAMDSDVLSGEVAKLATGIPKIKEVVKLNEEIALKESSRKFSESMNGFLKKAQEEIIKIQAQESVALSMVKEITEYFHGNSAKEEAHPFRIFLVVRDFLSILDHVCKEVGKINERTIYSSVRPMPVNPTLPPVFLGINGRRHNGSSDDESCPNLGA